MISSFSASMARGAVEQPCALRRRLHALGRAHQQRLAERLLQPADLHGDRGLCAPDAVRGASEGTALGDQHEGAQEVGVNPGRQRWHEAIIKDDDVPRQQNSFY
jgi:hypothetical protein